MPLHLIKAYYDSCLPITIHYNISKKMIKLLTRRQVTCRCVATAIAFCLSSMLFCDIVRGRGSICTSSFIPIGTDSLLTISSDTSRLGSGSLNCSAISFSFCLWSMAMVSENLRFSWMLIGCSVLMISTVLLVMRSTPSSSEEDGTRRGA